MAYQICNYFFGHFPFLVQINIILILTFVIQALAYGCKATRYNIYVEANMFEFREG